MRRQNAAAAADLLSPEGLAVGALVLRGIGLVGAHQDAVQGAVVLGVAMVSAGLDGTLNALVGVTIHVLFLLLFGTAIVWPERKNMSQGISSKVAFCWRL